MKIETAKDLEVYKSADQLAMEIFVTVKIAKPIHRSILRWSAGTSRAINTSNLRRAAPRSDACSAE
jgi:hypothetical protein